MTCFMLSCLLLLTDAVLHVIRLEYSSLTVCSLASGFSDRLDFDWVSPTDYAFAYWFSVLDCQHRGHGFNFHRGREMFQDIWPTYTPTESAIK